MDRILLDTNTLLDIAVEGGPDGDAAQELFDLAADSKVMAYVFPGSLKDFYFITRRDFDEETRRAWIALFLDTFLLATFDRRICIEALESDEPDFEDGLIRAAAEYERCDFIVTRDAAAFSGSAIQGVAPGDYVRSRRVM